MIAHGDELGRTQQGNNNVYCQDNELSWIDWGNADTELIEFTRTVSALRAAHPVFRGGGSSPGGRCASAAVTDHPTSPGSRPTVRR